MEVSPDGERLYAGDYDGGIWIFDTTTWEPMIHWNAHEARVRGLAISEDGERLVTTAQDDFVKVWDVSSVQEGASASQPPLLDRIPAPFPSDATWLSDDQLAIFLARGAKWLEISLDVQDLISEAAARLTRSFTSSECVTYQIDPCPTLEELQHD